MTDDQLADYETAAKEWRLHDPRTMAAMRANDANEAIFALVQEVRRLQGALSIAADEQQLANIMRMMMGDPQLAKMMGSILSQPKLLVRITKELQSDD